MSDALGILVCDTAAVVDGGPGMRFPVRAHGQDATGFVVRHAGTAYGWLNRCAHVPVELDGFHGEFFESEKKYLMCSMHGALYLPDTGACVGGPCRRGRLHPIAVHERDGRIYWQPDAHIQPRAAAGQGGQA